MRLDMHQAQKNNGVRIERREMETRRKGVSDVQIEKRERDKRVKRRPRNIRSLLRNASPNNPTYILAVVMADFNSQGFTELSVKKGDEIYAMYEIDDWAYVACLTETSRRGYIPVDFCLPVEDFFYHNPNLQKHQIRQESMKDVSRPPGLTSIKSQSRQTRGPIEGSETQSAPEHRYKQLYHTTGSLITSKQLTRPTENAMKHPFVTLRRSNTIDSTSKLLAEHQIRRTFSMNNRYGPAVAKKPTMQLTEPKSLHAASFQTLAKPTNLLVPPPVPAKPKIYMQAKNRPAVTGFQNPIDLDKERFGGTIKGKKTWTHLNIEECRRSSSLETVDERSELEESMNGTATSPGGIQRLIAKFQSKIKEDHRDLTGSTSRLNSTGSIASSVGDDNDSVFASNEEMPQINLSSMVIDNSEGNALLKKVSSNRTQSISPTLSERDEKPSDNITIEILEVSKADNNVGELPSPNLSTLELADSGLVSEDGVSDNLDFDESILEPPASFSSPSLSESIADIDSLTLETPPAAGHCYCCVHNRQIGATSDGTQIGGSIHSSADLTKRELLTPEFETKCVPKELCIEESTNEKTSDNEKTITINKQMRDESTQTVMNDKEAETTKSSTFSRNTKLRQSRLCEPAVESRYLMQPISPASITECNEPPENSSIEQTKHQYYVRL